MPTASAGPAARIGAVELVDQRVRRRRLGRAQDAARRASCPRGPRRRPSSRRRRRRSAARHARRTLPTQVRSDRDVGRGAASSACARGRRGGVRRARATYSPPLLRVARMYVPTPAVAEEVVQETWLGVLRGHRPLRGALLAEDVAVPHPRQPRQDARRARAAAACPSRRSRRPGAEDEPAVDADRFSPGTAAWVCAAAALGGRARGAPAVAEALGASTRRSPTLPDAQRDGDHHARRRGLAARGGPQRSGPHGDQPEGAVAPGTLQGTRRARGLTTQA